jgi:regulation of enolase protein 1 (concanavalin A-like superfamily)
MASSSAGQAPAFPTRRAIVNFAFSEWKKDVLESAADRFERRLTDETGKLRVEMSRMEVRLIRWMFVFWLGQLGVTLTVVTMILRST